MENKQGGKKVGGGVLPDWDSNVREGGGLTRPGMGLIPSLNQNAFTWRRRRGVGINFWKK